MVVIFQFFLFDGLVDRYTIKSWSGSETLNGALFKSLGTKPT